MPDRSELPPFTTNLWTGVPDDSWLNHVHNVTIQNYGNLQEIPVKYSGFYSHSLQGADVRPRDTAGVFPILN